MVKQKKAGYKWYHFNLIEIQMYVDGERDTEREIQRKRQKFLKNTIYQNNNSGQQEYN